VGQDFETRERIRQIEAKALRKLRRPSRNKRLRSLRGELAAPGFMPAEPYSGLPKAGFSA
jgi:hypothetical protein